MFLLKSPDLALVCVLFLVDLKETGEAVDMLGSDVCIRATVILKLRM